MRLYQESLSARARDVARQMDGRASAAWPPAPEPDGVAEALAARYPGVLALPPRGRRERLRPGDQVELVLLSPVWWAGREVPTPSGCGRPSGRPRQARRAGTPVP